MYFPRNKRGCTLAAPLVGHGQHLRANLSGSHGHGQVRAGARADGGVEHLVRVGLGVLQNLEQVLAGNRRVHDDGGPEVPEGNDGCDVLRQVVGRLVHHDARRELLLGVHEHQTVPIGL